jgi:hypothetical protein
LFFYLNLATGLLATASGFEQGHDAIKPSTDALRLGLIRVYRRLAADIESLTGTRFASI